MGAMKNIALLMEERKAKLRSLGLKPAPLWPKHRNRHSEAALGWLQRWHLITLRVRTRHETH